VIKNEEQKAANMKKIADIISFAEGINQKIKSDISFDAKQLALA